MWSYFSCDGNAGNSDDFRPKERDCVECFNSFTEEECPYCGNTQDVEYEEIVNEREYDPDDV